MAHSPFILLFLFEFAFFQVHSADVVASRLAVVDDDTGLEGDGEVVVVVAVVIERERLGLSESSSDHQCVH